MRHPLSEDAIIGLSVIGCFMVVAATVILLVVLITHHDDIAQRQQTVRDQQDQVQETARRATDMAACKTMPDPQTCVELVIHAASTNPAPVIINNK